MAIVKVRYFAAASEAAGREQEELDLGSDPTLGGLREVLEHAYGAPMSRVLRSGSFLVDGVVRRDPSHPVGAQVDILPPFAGG
ncbi:MoaD/ThiS family protein [Microbacterium murale]|uniref:Molybdopterin synthase sulfur carrier subunit n=1 Tax=Microbacterium murale TaxID=1081040 RepID=A0ABU0P7W2_9MICO|nr:MoaD/ThiS family protein [Microbacterium murale]MDQ0643426.1 molybdopterin synthase sulfur carrier subunit [Microbacterium murale]